MTGSSGLLAALASPGCRVPVLLVDDPSALALAAKDSLLQISYTSVSTLDFPLKDLLALRGLFRLCLQLLMQRLLTLPSALGLCLQPLAMLALQPFYPL